VPSKPVRVNFLGDSNRPSNQSRKSPTYGHWDVGLSEITLCTGQAFSLHNPALHSAMQRSAMTSQHPSSINTVARASSGAHGRTGVGKAKPPTPSKVGECDRLPDVEEARFLKSIPFTQFTWCWWFCFTWCWSMGGFAFIPARDIIDVYFQGYLGTNIYGNLKNLYLVSACKRQLSQVWRNLNSASDELRSNLCTLVCI
jgi:hypothetical protein